MTKASDNVTWFVVADGKRARFLMRTGVTAPLQAAPVAEMSQDNPPTHDQGTERPGRTQESAGTGTRHALTPRTDWHQFEKEKFAHEVARRVNHAAGEHAFRHLVLVAPPATLGKLREFLGKPASDALTQEIAKDITHMSMLEMSDYLVDRE